ncbi:NrtR DNA-binding winged helix domain-containing protein, partial [Cronobacter sakazakii]|uniref:NrtR DNA-binding winged helix domain-containing protein n=1 Tax=Cronobacter sakazakii TaxID=28141 RepID=UPI0039C8AC56
MYSLLPVYCLPECFTLSQLQEATEIILGQPIQRKSLIRRFEAIRISVSLNKNAFFILFCGN